MSLEKKVPQYLSLLESDSTPEYLKHNLREVFRSMGVLIDSLQKDKILDINLDYLEEEETQQEMFDTGTPTSHYVNQDPDLKKPSVWVVPKKKKG